MITLPMFDPVILDLPGPLTINYYGLSYLLTAVLCFWWANKRASWYPDRGFTPAIHADLLTYVMIGVVVGGRVGYVLFYDLATFLEDPLFLVRAWDGGMSFHGGFLGVCAAYLLFARRHNIRFFDVADWVAPVVPIGVTLVRFANTINGELWGRPTDSAFGAYFSNAPLHVDGSMILRHPSTFYEMLLEGVLLFIVLNWFARKPRPRMAVSGLFVLGYGLARAFVENFRQPDAHIGFLMGDWLTMGMVLSTPMILVGAAMLILAYTHQRFTGTEDKGPIVDAHRQKA